MRHRVATLCLAFAVATAAAADEYDRHRAAVLDMMLRQLAREHRRAVVFVRMMDECWDVPARHNGCVDLSDQTLKWLRKRGHKVSRVPEASRYYLHGHPSEHEGKFDAPPPDWEYLPMYTPGAEWRTYCEVELVRPLYTLNGQYIRGVCYEGKPGTKVLAGGNFLVREERGELVIEPFQPLVVFPPPAESAQ